MSNEQKLLEKLAKLSFSDRLKQMLELGREARQAKNNAVQTLAGLEQAEGDFYRQHLALLACWGSHDMTFPLEIIQKSSSSKLRGLALDIVHTIGSDDEVVTTLLQIDKATRRKFFCKLTSRKRQKPLDLVLEILVNNGQESEVPELLHFGSLAVVERYFSIFEKSAGPLQWSSLAGYHTRFVVDYLQTQIRQAAPGLVDRQLLARINASLQSAAAKTGADADAGVELAQASLESRLFSPNQLELQALLNRRPAKIVKLLLATDLESGSPTNLRFYEIVHRKGLGDQPDLVAGLLERFAATINLGWSFKKLAAATRDKLFERFQFGWRDKDGAIAPLYVGLLSANLRHPEARRNLSLAALQAVPAQRLPYASFLPWEEAHALLKPFMGDPDPTLRQASLEALLNVIRYERDKLGEGLELIKTRKNEQDPVRAAMLYCLQELPPSTWQAESHLTELGQIIRQALNAADLSYLSASRIEQIIFKILPFHPEWAAEWLATLVKERGNLTSYNLDKKLTKREVAYIAPALDPVLVAWETRERSNQIIQAAQSFGRLIWDNLAKLLERLAKKAIAQTAASALVGLKMYQRERFKALVPELLKQDASWATQEAVYSYLHRSRQDLLTPYLGQTAFKGKFSTGKTRWVLPFYSGFERWTPDQQLIYARTISAVTGDKERDTPALLGIIDQLAALPALVPTRLIELANDEREAIREKAIQALSHYHDARQTLPTLLECMGDKRARVAIYALRKIILKIPQTEALQLLQQVALTKVTVAKEVLRLIGDLHIPAAYEYLIKLSRTQQDLHRDVRVALLRSLWEYPAEAETWQVLEAASREADPAIATISGRMPAERLSGEGRQHLLKLINNLLVHPEARVRLDALARCQTMPITDSERILQPALFQTVQSQLPQERKAAVNAICTTYQAENDAPLIGEAFRQLLKLPDLQPLKQATQRLHVNLATQGAQLRPAARQVIVALSTEPIALGLEIELAIKALEETELANFLTELVSTRADLHAELLAKTFSWLESTPDFRQKAETFAHLERQFATHADERVRRMGLAMLIGTARWSPGWIPEYKQRLESYRQDSSLLVSSAARFTFPPAAE